MHPVKILEAAISASLYRFLFSNVVILWNLPYAHSEILTGQREQTFPRTLSLRILYPPFSRVSVSSMNSLAPTTDDLSLLPERWRSVPRRWGHPLHSLCSYFAMFPPQMARVLIGWLTEPGDTVYDPFSGRGTVALESLLMGRTSLGSDANPLAEVLTRAKTAVPSHVCVADRLEALEASFTATPTDISLVNPDIRMLYSDSTMTQIQFLKHSLNRSDAVDNFIAALVLGMLHANHGKSGATRGFSISMPNTFAMSPRYVKRYILEHRLQRPNVDVFKMLRHRVDRMGLPASEVIGGQAWRQDATIPTELNSGNSMPRLVLTSPPYLEVIRYGKYNWVRLWFLGHDPQEVDRQLMATGSLDRYLEFMRSVCTSIQQTADPNGFVCFVIGDVRQTRSSGVRHINLATEVWQHVAMPMGWKLHAIIEDALPESRKVSRIWKNGRGQATKVDRILLMSLTERSLPQLSATDWQIDIQT